jgi:hypothetical protein
MMETNPSSETLCSVEFRMMDEVLKPSNHKCYTSSSETFKTGLRNIDRNNHEIWRILYWKCIKPFFVTTVLHGHVQLKHKAGRPGCTVTSFRQNISQFKLLSCAAHVQSLPVIAADTQHILPLDEEIWVFTAIYHVSWHRMYSCVLGDKWVTARSKWN